ARAGRAGGARARPARGAGAEGFRDERPPARRDLRGRLGGPRRRRRAGVPARPEALTSELVYGRRPVREALRGPRVVLEVLATQRALKAEPWLEDDGPRVQVKLERELTAEAGTQDHQGVVALVEPYRYPDAHQLSARPPPPLP